MRNAPLNDHYEILGVSRNATGEQIRKAYRRLALEYHPDVNQGNRESEDRFKQLSKAYEILGDPVRRREYDMFGAEANRVQADRDDAGFSRSFRCASGNPACRGRKMNAWPWSGLRGNDVYQSLSIGREEACGGAKRLLILTRRDRCPACRGRGIKHGFEFDACPSCGGRGSLNEKRHVIFGTSSRITACRRCGGTGSVNLHPCESCGGNGTLEAREEVEMEIPPGARTGQLIRVAGKGEDGLRGGPPGDLLVELVVEGPAAPFLDKILGRSSRLSSMGTPRNSISR